jgi:hypothetical protein
MMRSTLSQSQRRVDQLNRQRARRPVLILAYFMIGPPPDHAQLHVFIGAVKAAGLPAGVSTYIGTYGPNQAPADAVEALPATYAPLFSIQPSTSKQAYGGRRLTPEQNALLDPRYDHPLPLVIPGEPLPARDHLKWGLAHSRVLRGGRPANPPARALEPGADAGLRQAKRPPLNPPQRARH